MGAATPHARFRPTVSADLAHNLRTPRKRCVRIARLRADSARPANSERATADALQARVELFLLRAGRLQGSADVAQNVAEAGDGTGDGLAALPLLRGGGGGRRGAGGGPGVAARRRRREVQRRRARDRVASPTPDEQENAAHPGHASAGIAVAKRLQNIPTPATPALRSRHSRRARSEDGLCRVGQGALVTAHPPLAISPASLLASAGMAVPAASPVVSKAGISSWRRRGADEAKQQIASARARRGVTESLAGPAPGRAGLRGAGRIRSRHRWPRGRPAESRYRRPSPVDAAARPGSARPGLGGPGPSPRAEAKVRAEAGAGAADAPPSKAEADEQPKTN